MTAQRLILPFDSDTRWQELGLDLRVAAGSDAPLLITGNRDAARLVARTIHDRSPLRRSAPFTIGQHKTLFETLASLSMHFRTAHGSTFASTADHAPATLYIDEVDRLTPDAQEILMYFLEVTHGSPAANQAVRLVTATTGDPRRSRGGRRVSRRPVLSSQRRPPRAAEGLGRERDTDSSASVVPPGLIDPGPRPTRLAAVVRTRTRR